MPVKTKIVVDRSLSQLSKLVSAAGIQLKPEIAPVIPQAQKPIHQSMAKEDATPERSDEEFFDEAMHGVHRVSWRHDPHPSSQSISVPSSDPDLEARQLMQSAIEEDIPMAGLDHPEYIEGWIGVSGRKFLPKLRNGLYSIQGQIDLHGYGRMEAQIAVEDFISHMARFSSCCIKIIHGRGINSPTHKATLKESLQRWLKTRKMSRFVVAYASAQSCDGGVGAVYVLLRRQ